MFASLWRNRQLIMQLTRRDVLGRYRGSLLGLAWSYVQPAMRFGVYYVVMGFILNLHEGVPFFAIHLFTGIVVVHYFGETWNGGTTCWFHTALNDPTYVPAVKTSFWIALRFAWIFVRMARSSADASSFSLPSRVKTRSVSSGRFQ